MKLLIAVLLAQAGGLTGTELPVPRQDTEPVPRVICSSVGGPVRLGQDPVTVPLKCCEKGFYIPDPNHPADEKGNLICVRDT